MNGAMVLTKFTGDTSDLTKKTQEAKGQLSSLEKAFIGGGAAVSVLTSAYVTAGKAVVKMTEVGVKSAGELEQSIGGIETIYKDSADMMKKYAEDAFKTAGISANNYMQQATSFGASLLQATGGDAKKAAEAANKAIIDMSDNANKMGTSIESIQHAYQGFAKQNYTMLDNLKLGYGGTKTEMGRLLADAEKLTGVKYNIKNLTDVYEAIHVIQNNLGITGTTSKEAATTFEGSMKQLNAAWQNFMSGAGDPKDLVDNLVNSFKTVVDVVLPMILQIAPRLVTGLVEIVNAIIPMIPDIIKALLPALIEGAKALIIGIINVLPDLVLMIADMLPTLIPMLVDAFMAIIPALLERTPDLINAGFQLIGGLIAGIINAVPVLLARIGEIIVKFIKAWKDINLKDIGANLLKGLWNGITSMKDWVINKVKDLGKSILKGLKSILGIKSPSKEFALIGKFSVLGYTEALDDMQKDVQKQVNETFAVSPQLANSSALSYSSNVQVFNNISMKQDPLGQMVNDIKTFSGGSKNDYNYGMGV